MSGLAAWFNDPHHAPSPNAFRRALGAVAERGRAGRIEIEVDGGWIGAAVDDEGDAGSFGPFTVALDGHPTNLRALTAEQAGRESGATTPSEVIAAIFAEIGVEQGLSRMDGAFALIAWDAQSKTMWAIRDRLGTRPMFVGQGGGGVLVASTPSAAHPHGFDVTGLERLARLGFLPPPLSVMAGAARVPAGCLWRSARGAAPADGRPPGRPSGTSGTSGIERWWDAAAGVPGEGGALVRWVQSLEFAARLCVRSAAAEPDVAVWVEDEAGLAVLAAAGHPVHGKARAFVVDIEGEPRLGIEPGYARTVDRIPLGPDDLDQALDDLAALDEPAVLPDALLWWAVGQRALRTELRAVLTGRGVEAWLESNGGRAGGGRAGAGRAGGEAGGLAARLAGRFARPGAPQPEESCLELDRIRAEAPAQPAPTSWMQRRVTLAEGALRTADLVGTGAGVRFVSPLCDPRLVQLGTSVPLGHHPQIARRLWAAMGATTGSPPAKRSVIPLRRWLTGGAAHTLIDLPQRLERLVDSGSVQALIAALPGSDTAANRLFALLVIERWSRGR